MMRFDKTVVGLYLAGMLLAVCLVGAAQSEEPPVSEPAPTTVEPAPQVPEAQSDSPSGEVQERAVIRDHRGQPGGLLPPPAVPIPGAPPPIVRDHRTPPVGGGLSNVDLGSLPRECVPGTGTRRGPDADGDGIDDSCEQQLAELYAPVVYHSSDESNYPTNVDWFLPKTSLWFYDDACTPDLKREIKRSPTQANIVAHDYRGGCDAKNTVYSNGTRSNKKQRTFFFADVADQFRRGSPDTRDWTTYYHAYPNSNGGMTIQYWRFYAYNDAANNHGGDWEGIHLILDRNLQPANIGFMGHTSIDYLPPSRLQWDGTHPRIFSEGGGHASHADGSGIKARGCAVNIVCVTNPNNAHTFVRQETWAGGQVRWFDGRLTPGGHLINLGAKTRPMNGQVFVQYSGIWGSPGSLYFTSGYWAPAYNETGMGNDGFITAWCAGMKSPSHTECYPQAVSR